MLTVQGAVELGSAPRQADDLLVDPNGTTFGFPEFQSVQRRGRPLVILARLRIPQRGEKNDSL
jgi:hypothetical protein